MKLENRVVSEELAKKMSDLAISNLDEPLFWWEVFTDDGDSHIRTHDQMIKRIKTQAKVEMYPALTLGELILLLMDYPEEIDMVHRLCDLTANYLARRLIFRKESYRGK